MTKNEAMQALDNGHKLTHVYFSPNEWIMGHKVGSATYRTEDGYTVDRDIFWRDRQGEAWETGWSLWKDPSQTTPSPLWRELNEDRTQGEWRVTEGQPFIMAGQKDLMKPILDVKNGRDFTEAFANPAYAVLAVNNLHKLAEALEWVENEIKTTPDALSDALQGVILIKIKQALASIS